MEVRAESGIVGAKKPDLDTRSGFMGFSVDIYQVLPDGNYWQVHIYGVCCPVCFIMVW